jgi:uncharacterized protein YidB (DUF937 family)
MGLLDQVMGAATSVLGQGAGQGGADGIGHVLSALLSPQGPTGGLGGMLSQFQQNGLGEVMQSWIGTGQNLPISPEQLHQALGGDMVSKLSSQFGIDPQALLGQAAQMLPGLVDSLTPGGQLPTDGGGMASDLMGMLARAAQK